MDRTNITDAEVFMVLYNRARTGGRAVLAYNPAPMSLEEAKKVVCAKGPVSYVDYFMGRVMKIDIAENPLNTLLYNRDNGPGAAEEALMDYMTAPKA